MQFTNYVVSKDGAARGVRGQFGDAQDRSKDGFDAGRLVPGMDVCDIDGKKLGTLGHVYSRAATSGDGDVPVAQGMDILEVHTGLLGLGTHLYVPATAVQDVTSNGVFLNLPKADIPSQGWDVKPESH